MSNTSRIANRAINVSPNITAATRPASLSATSVTSMPDPWTPYFVLSIAEMKQRADMKQTFLKEVMIRDVHYGSLGNNKKPTLLKPGAELLLHSMALTWEFTDAESPIRDYTESTDGEGLVLYRRDCLVYRQCGDIRFLVVRAQGTCSSRETQYRYREMKRLCPTCKQPALIVSDYAPEWVCWEKKGGCKAKFPTGDPSIENQEVGLELNPNLADYENTIEKMADKRALVAAALLACGCSDLFTQDMEHAIIPATAETLATIPEVVQPRDLATPATITVKMPIDQPPESSTITTTVLDHLKETVSLYHSRGIPRQIFEDMVFAHLGAKKIEATATTSQATNLRNAVMSWSAPPLDEIKPADISAEAFSIAIPDARIREAYLEQIDPNAISIADLTQAQRSSLASLVYQQVAA